MSLKWREYWKVWTSLTPWRQSKLHPVNKTTWYGQKPQNKLQSWVSLVHLLSVWLLAASALCWHVACGSVGLVLTDRRPTHVSSSTSIAVTTISVSVSPFLYFLSHCSCTQGSRFSVDYFLSSNPTFLMAAHFFFLTLWRLCTDSTPCNVNGPFPALFNAVLKSDYPIIHCLLKLVHPL